MKVYLNSLVKSLKNFSLSLDKKAFLIDKPWALFDPDLQVQKIIFKKNGELINSIEGKVTFGKWEYFAEAKAILIDTGFEKVLCREAFLNEAVIVLKRDGNNMDFVVFANENLIPDLNVPKYLMNLRIERLSIIKKELEDGRIIEVERKNENHVTIDFEDVPNGEYELKNSKKKYVIKNGLIVNIVEEFSYSTKNGPNIYVDQALPERYNIGEKVRINKNTVAPDGKYRVIGGMNIVVTDGKISWIGLF